MPKRERYVWVCTNRRADDNPKGSCAAKGSEALQQRLKVAVAEAGLQGRVRVSSSGCVDLCWRGAAVAVMPDMAFFGRLTPDDVPALVAALQRESNVAEDPHLRDKLVLPHEFDEKTAGSLGAPANVVSLGRGKPT